MQLNSNQKIQKMLSQIQYLDPHLLCGSKNKITLVCINKECKAPSLHCLNQKCTFCEVHQENSCNSVQLRSLTTLMKKKSQNLKYFIQQLIKIQTIMFKAIQNKRIQLLQKTKHGNLTNQEMNIVQNIFGDHSISNRFRANSNKFKGCQIADLIQKLKKFNQTFRVDDQIRILKSRMNEITDQIITLQKKAIDEIIRPTKYYAKVDSKIMEQDPAGLRFILQQLYHPPELKLLYRASEHGFSVEEFHKKCDNKSNTLIIAKTKHKKVIAGFTPLTWTSDLCRSKVDHKRATFVLSINLRQKYQLTQPDQAIRCKKEWGPIFGGFDFAISQNSSTGQIQSLFPFKFNSKAKYEKGEQRIKQILGQGNHNRINLQEWQVYGVINQQI